MILSPKVYAAEVEKYKECVIFAPDPALRGEECSAIIVLPGWGVPGKDELKKWIPEAKKKDFIKM